MRSRCAICSAVVLSAWIARGADEVRLSAFAPQAQDATVAVQAALDAGARTVFFDCGPLVTTPLKVRSNTRVVFAEGVELQAKPGAFRGVRDALVDCGGATNVQLIGLGMRGGVLRMRKDDYRRPPYVKAEWRHCLRLVDAQQVAVSNMSFIASGGDGICTGRSTRDVVIDSCTCDDNYRQGISVCGAENLLIRNCTLSNTRGTLPAAGIDFEPDAWNEPIANCRMVNCRLTGNGGAGIDVYLPNLGRRSKPIGLVIENCIVAGNGGAGMTTTIGSSRVAMDDLPSGQLVVRGCAFSRNGGGPAEFGFKPAAFPVRWRDCVISNETRGISFKPGHWETPMADNVHFENLTWHAPDAFKGFERIVHNLMVPVPTNVCGDITFVRPNGMCERRLLDAAWRADVFAAPRYPDFPSRVPPDFSGRKAKLVDKAPGRMVSLEPAEVLWGGRYVFFADAPGEVHLRVRQVAKEPGSTATDIGNVIVKRHPSNAKSILNFPYPKLESENVAIRVPARGFYFMISQNQYARFLVETADVPVAFWCRRAQQLFFSDDAEHAFLMPVQPRGGRFAVLAKAGSGSSAVISLRDPEGAQRAHFEAGREWTPFVSQEEPASGVWKLVVGKSDATARRYVFLDTAGSAPFLFLSPEKYVIFNP